MGKLNSKYLSSIGQPSGKLLGISSDGNISFVSPLGGYSTVKLTVLQENIDSGWIQLPININEKFKEHTILIVNGVIVMTIGDDFNITASESGNLNRLVWAGYSLSSSITPGMTLYLQAPSISTNTLNVTQEIKVITNADIENKCIFLNNEILPNKADFTEISIFSGVQLVPDIDFSILRTESGFLRKISWDGKEADGVLSVGDKILVSYFAM